MAERHCHRGLDVRAVGQGRKAEQERDVQPMGNTGPDKDDFFGTSKPHWILLRSGRIKIAVTLISYS